MVSNRTIGSSKTAQQDLLLTYQTFLKAGPTLAGQLEIFHHQRTDRRRILDSTSFPSPTEKRTTITVNGDNGDGKALLLLMLSTSSILGRLSLSRK